jgi:hypothetical protein
MAGFDHLPFTSLSASPLPSTTTQNLALAHEIESGLYRSIDVAFDQVPFMSYRTSPDSETAAQNFVVGHEIANPCALIGICDDQLFPLKTMADA